MKKLKDLSIARKLTMIAMLTCVVALILASAHITGCAVLITEDMGNGEVLAGVKLVNPFASS